MSFISYFSSSSFITIEDDEDCICSMKKSYDVDLSYVSKRFGVQIKSIDSVPVFDFKPNRTKCQEIKSLNSRFDLSSFDLKPTEIDRKEYIQRR